MSAAHILQIMGFIFYYTSSTAPLVTEDTPEAWSKQKELLVESGLQT